MSGRRRSSVVQAFDTFVGQSPAQKTAAPAADGSPEKKSGGGNPLYYALGAFVAYLGIGGLFYTEVCGYTWLDSFYFAVVTFTTVGYGDVLPDTTASKMFTCVFAFVGVSLIGAAMGIIAAQVMDHIDAATKAQIAMLAEADAAMKAKLMSATTRPSADAGDGDEPAEAEDNPQPSIMARLEGLRKSALQTVVVILLGAVVFRSTEGWSFSDAFYVACITVSTVGFGDLSPATVDGRLFAIFYIPLGVAIVGGLLGSVAAIPLQIRSDRIEAEILASFGDDLDKDELIELTKGGATPGVCT